MSDNHCYRIQSILKTETMNKKIEDYLHLYLGCECMVDGRKGTIEGVSTSSAGCSGNNPLIYFEDGEVSAGEEDIEDVKPILRPIESMTEDERAAIWEIVFNRPFPQSGRTMIVDRETHSAHPRWILMSGVERLGISFNGYDVWADSDLQHWKHNQHEITRYLLSKHFDLFDLIPSGLAISSNSQSK